MNTYCLFKGTLLRAAPFNDKYVGSPHYVITVADKPSGKPFNIVVNSASTQASPGGNNEVYIYVDAHFTDPVTDKLAALGTGLHLRDFPRLDYWQDRSLLDLHRMRPVPYENEGNRFDVNDVINALLTIDESTPSQDLPYDNGSGNLHDRTFWKPTDPAVTVYGFGFLFLPKEDGLHETHMNQGNPPGPHFKENGAFQDGAVIIQRADGFSAVFTAFQTQFLPTDAAGRPVQGAKSLPDFIIGQ